MNKELARTKRGLMRDRTLVGLRILIDFLGDHGTPGELSEAWLRYNLTRWLRQALSMRWGGRQEVAIGEADGREYRAVIRRKEKVGRVIVETGYWTVIGVSQAAGIGLYFIKPDEPDTLGKVIREVGRVRSKIRTDRKWATYQDNPEAYMDYAIRAEDALKLVSEYREE